MHHAITDNGSGVEQLSRDPLRMSHDDPNAMDAAGKSIQFTGTSVIEIIAQQQILRRIATQRQLGGQHQIGALRTGPFGGIQNRGRVSWQVAHGTVDLGDRDFHSRTIAFSQSRSARLA